MGAAVLIFFALPWLDRSPVKSIRYRGWRYKVWLAAFVVSFLVLGYLGVVPVTVWGQFPRAFRCSEPPTSRPSSRGSSRSSISCSSS